ncbi:MAG: transcription elongation factor GreAB [Rhodobacterales bacterium]|nr:transcription elongation factor GreAB [Rhodobacterales bacterium]
MSPAKPKVLAAIVAALDLELRSLVKATELALDEATNAETKPENKYDTRGLEASYLAGAQSERLLVLKQRVRFYGVFQAPDFTEDDPIRLGALVCLENDDGVRWVFMGPEGGGLTLDVDDHRVVVLSPRAPLGCALVGRRVGDGVKIWSPKGPRFWEIVEVH